MSNKNILQEYCQKNKLDMPIYMSKFTGPAHKLDWFCKIKVLDIEIETVNPSNSKINAEQAAAKLVLEHLETIQLSNSKQSTESTYDDSEINSIYLIDLENKPMFNQKMNSNSLYIGFHNSLHHSVSKYIDWHVCQSPDLEKELSISQSNKLIYFIEGGISDLVDHLMTMFVYPLTLYLKTMNQPKTVYIVSGDNAGFCTKICLEKALKWHNITHITIKNTISIN